MGKSDVFNTNIMIPIHINSVTITNSINGMVTTSMVVLKSLVIDKSIVAAVSEIWAVYLKYVATEQARVYIG